MDEAGYDILAYMTFPKEYRVKLRSTNPIERLNGEIKRRTDVVGNRAFLRTAYGWLPRDKGGDRRQLVGCGHVFGVSIATGSRALMNVRVRQGPDQWHALEALRFERGIPAPFPSVCPHPNLPSPFRSGRGRPGVRLLSSRSPGLPCPKHGPNGACHAVGQRNGYNHEGSEQTRDSGAVHVRVNGTGGWYDVIGGQ